MDINKIVSLYYRPDVNRFTDDFGNVIHDIFRFITPGQYLIFRKYKNKYCIHDKTNSFVVEMIYPDVKSLPFYEYEY